MLWSAPRHPFLVLLICVIYLIPVHKIIRRAGWNGWLVLLWLIPLVNVVVLWVFAFGRWPNLPEPKPQ
jgi:hypothetical protein